MGKEWTQKAISLLEDSLNPIIQELNELDWKESLSPNKEKLARHLSAFANLPGGGFMVFGIQDKSGAVIGVSSQESKIIIEKLSNLGRDAVDPVITIDHATELYQEKPLLFVHIHESSVKPVHIRSGGIEDSYIRSGGSTRKASRQEIGGLMLNSKTPQFEELHCSSLRSSDEILTALDFRGIYELLDKPIPQDRSEILRFLVSEKLVDQHDTGYYITNLGALSAAHSLHEFDGLSRKAVRLIRYDGLNKEKTKKEFPGSKGYAISFQALIDFIKALLPGSEIIRDALRVDTMIYPEVALRELIANALIHQDFSIRGSGPMIEIFDDRMEISNPGKLLPSKKIDRLIGATPESRNELLASVFRRFNICEERGSGFQKAVSGIEIFGLPPLKFIEEENSFRVVIYSPRKFADMSLDERVEATYQHSIIRYYSSSGLTNASLRERFKMNESQRPQISLVIKEALVRNKIKAKDPNNASTKFAEYIPFWG